MKRCLLFFFLPALLFAQEGDSMAYFKMLIENMKAPVSDVGGFMAPEIFSVEPYSLEDKSGFLIRAKVLPYSSMVSYKVKKVGIRIWTERSGKKEQAMELEDEAQGIYALSFPFSFQEELFYAVSAEDDWGNRAIELLPDGKEELIMEDRRDEALPEALDIKALRASYSKGGLKLCLDLYGKPKRTIGQAVTLYGILVFGQDARFKPFQIEGQEIGSGWIAGYIPYLRVQDIFPASEVFSLLSLPSQKEPKAVFTSEGSSLCFQFQPALIRKDFSAGLKIAGLSLRATVTPFAIAPADATKMVTLYPVLRSYFPGRESFLP